MEKEYFLGGAQNHSSTGDRRWSEDIVQTKIQGQIKHSWYRCSLYLCSIVAAKMKPMFSFVQ